MRRSDDHMTMLRTAFHEAAHAVMAHLCGQIVTWVEIVGDEDHTGTTSSLRFLGEPEWRSSENIPSASYEGRILCLLAGVAAETVLTGDTDWSEAEEDIDEAVRLALRVIGTCDEVLPYLEQARDHAVELLVRHWSAVEELAWLLVRERVVEGDVVRRVLQRTLDDEAEDAEQDRVA